MWISQEQIKNSMGGGLCQPPCASQSDGTGALAHPQCQTHGASLGDCLGFATSTNGSGLQTLTLGIGHTDQHTTGVLEQLLLSHDSQGVVVCSGSLAPMNIVWHPAPPPATTTVPPLELSSHLHSHPHAPVYYEHKRTRAGVSLMMKWSPRPLQQNNYNKI
jgi:hypothetical protein